MRRLNIKRACKTLNISRSGFYEYLNRKPSNRSLENEIYCDKIRTIFEEHKARYGSMRISKSLEQDGFRISRPRVARLMRRMNLHAKGTRYHYKYCCKVTQDSRPNLLNQVFYATQAKSIWLGDITYIPTTKGTLYLAVYLDIYSRKIVGWSMDTTMKEKLVTDAFLQAYGREHPAAGLIVHSDQGSQYTSDNFRMVLKKHGAIQSNSRKGNPYDNAMMESFYRTLKRELLTDQPFVTPDQAKLAVFEYIELYYNTKRMHSSLGYVSPVQFEDQNHGSEKFS